MMFRQHMAQGIANTLAEFPAEAAPDIYTVTFRIDYVEQDARFPYLAIGYHTETEVARLLAGPGSLDSWEVRWSYAYFAPSGLAGIRIAGHHPEHDPVGAGLHREESQAQGLWYEDQDGLAESDRRERDEQLGARFYELCIELARDLHTSGRIVESLGRPLPVILYDMFDPDEMFALTKAANPAALIADFMSAYSAEDD
jgi:hypothetical protein